MTIKIIVAAGVLAAALAPALANAEFVLDTGTPGAATATVVNGTQWLAAEFTLTGAEDITSISAFINQGAGNVGDKYSYYLYGSGLIGATAANRPALQVGSPITGTFQANGWNTTATDVVLGAGTYWLAIETTAAQSKGFSLFNQVSAGTGSVPAQAFAWYSTTGTASKFSTAGAPTFGLQVSGSPVPLPAAVWLLGSGLAGLGALRRRRA